MGRIALILSLVLPLAAVAEPGMEGIPDGEIVTPHLHRHVIGAPDSAQAPATDRATTVADADADVTPAPERATRKARHPAAKAKKAQADDASDLIPDLPGADDASAVPSDDAAAQAAALAGSDDSAAANAAALAGSDERRPAARAVTSDETQIALPEHRPVSHAPVAVEPPSEPTTETLEATEPQAPPAAPTPAFAEELPAPSVPAPALDSSSPQPMRNLRLGAGLALVGLMGANLAMTQLDHADHFLGDDTGRFAAPHHDTEYATFGGMGILSLVELLSEDSHSLAHKIGFGVAVAATALQAGLLVATDARVGYSDQLSYSRAHLAASWAGAVATAVSSIALAF